MKQNKSLWDKSLWTALVILSLLLWGEFAIIKYESERLTRKRNKELRDTYSPMSDDPEIQKAYDEIRPDPYIRGVDTFAMESP